MSEVMKLVGGANSKIGMPEMRFGTMDEVIYPARGTFDDWAYAASKFPSMVTACKNYQYPAYPSEMTNGLVFIIELGQQEVG